MDSPLVITPQAHVHCTHTTTSVIKETLNCGYLEILVQLLDTPPPSHKRYFIGYRSVSSSQRLNKFAEEARKYIIAVHERP